MKKLTNIEMPTIAGGDVTGSCFYKLKNNTTVFYDDRYSGSDCLRLVCSSAIRNRGDAHFNAYHDHGRVVGYELYSGAINDGKKPYINYPNMNIKPSGKLISTGSCTDWKE